MPQFRIMEETGHFSPNCIWEGASAIDSIGSRITADQLVVDRMAEAELRVEMRTGIDWIDVGSVESYMPDVCSLDEFEESDDDIMVGWKLDDESAWTDLVPVVAPSRQELEVRQAIIAEAFEHARESVTPIRNFCMYCPGETEKPHDMVCGDCLQSAAFRPLNYCSACDTRLKEHERHEGYCGDCSARYEIPFEGIERRHRYRPFGRADLRRKAS